MKDQYITYVIIAFLKGEQITDISSDEWRPIEQFNVITGNISKAAFEATGYKINSRVYLRHSKAIFSEFLKSDIVEFEGDEFVGQFFRFNIIKLNNSVSKLINDSADFTRIQKLGMPALSKALERIAAEDQFAVEDKNENFAKDNSLDVPILSDAIPASDRIVSIGDNERKTVLELTIELNKHLNRENAIDGDLNLKDRFVAQISAGRELFHASSVRAYLVYETFVGMLNILIEKFKDQAIGEISKKLLELLFQRIFGN